MLHLQIFPIRFLAQKRKNLIWRMMNGLWLNLHEFCGNFDESQKVTIMKKRIRSVRLKGIIYTKGSSASA
ncbi:hypothetical protein BpHYR1_038229 [Brachionus plicatilis]|uniref:Uncharacterized protein n=1 Tax=Brachionus plicatilis TaxID=10195 RepID=A0A3M7PCF6_BRAPC|nr:hypothetical protein BpHYR1_038229 [Brachionus plicatilis]